MDRLIQLRNGDWIDLRTVVQVLVGTVNVRCVVVVEEHNTWNHLMELASEAEADAYRDELAKLVNDACREPAQADEPKTRPEWRPQL